MTTALSPLAATQAVLWGGLAIGLALGAAAQASRFCTMGALTDWFSYGGTARLTTWILAAAVAALPVVVLLGAIAVCKIRVHIAALLGLAIAFAIALFVYRMPLSAATGSALYGSAFGLFPIGWIILNVIFLYQLTVERGLFATMRDSLARVAPDPRVQLILIAFSFGAFLEGMAGFGAPVAITGAILIQLGFKPLHASGLALIANTAPVAFGSLGIPITTMDRSLD